MTLTMSPMKCNSWVGAIRNPSLSVGGMIKINDLDGSTIYFIPSIHQGHQPDDAYPVDCRRIEVY